MTKFALNMFNPNIEFNMETNNINRMGCLIALFIGFVLGIVFIYLSLDKDELIEYGVLPFFLAVPLAVGLRIHYIENNKEKGRIFEILLTLLIAGLFLYFICTTILSAIWVTFGFIFLASLLGYCLYKIYKVLDSEDDEFD